MEPVGRLDYLRSPDRRRPDHDVDHDRVDLGVVVDVDAGKDVTARRDAGLVVAEAGRRGADEPEREVVAEVDVDQFGQCSLSLGEIGRLLRCEVHVLGGARTGHPGEHAHPPLSSHAECSPWTKTRVRNRSKRACRIWASTLAALTPGPACWAAFFAASLIADSSDRQLS
jgi:hypothetical protein